jgi:3-phosphoinositide dependent protein kinase-1
MHVKLTDFGTSTQLNAEASEGSSDPSDPTISRSTSFVGTAEYVPPELLKDKFCCPASDLWALGAMIFQMMTGRMAFHGATQFLTFQIVQKVRER